MKRIYMVILIVLGFLSLNKYPDNKDDLMIYGSLGLQQLMNEISEVCLDKHGLKIKYEVDNDVKRNVHIKTGNPNDICLFYKDFMIISNKAYEIALTSDELKDIFVGKVTTWNDGNPITLHVKPNAAPSRFTFERILGIQVTDDSIPQDGGRSMVASVFDDPKGIGFTYYRETDSVHIISIDGLLPNDEHYPLRYGYYLELESVDIKTLGFLLLLKTDDMVEIIEAHDYRARQP